MNDHTHSDSIGFAELIPDLGVFIASLFAQQGLMKLRSGAATPGGYQQIAKTLTEQFMPDKTGKGIEDEIIFNEMTMFFTPPEKAKLFALLDAISKDEKRFLINTLAHWAAKYQKENKKSQKGPDGKDTVTGSAFMEPLTVDNPAVKFLRAILDDAETPRSIETLVDELRKSGMIQKSTRDKFIQKWKNYQERSGLTTEQFVVVLGNQFLEHHVLKKATVGPLGLCFAYAIGKGDLVQLGGIAPIKALWSKAFGRDKRNTKE